MCSCGLHPTAWYCTVPQAEALGTLIIAINLGLVLYYLATMLASVLRPSAAALASRLRGWRARVSTTLSSIFSLHVPSTSPRGSLTNVSKRLSSIFGRKGPGPGSATTAASGSSLQPRAREATPARASATWQADPIGTQARSSASAASLMQSGDGAAGAHDSQGKGGAAASPSAEAGTKGLEDMANG